MRARKPLKMLTFWFFKFPFDSRLIALVKSRFIEFEKKNRVACEQPENPNLFMSRKRSNRFCKSVRLFSLARQSPHGQWRRESADWRKPTFDKAEAGNANEPEPKRSRPDGRTKLDVHKMSISCRNCAEELEENNLRMLRQGVGVILRRRCERV